MEVTALTWIVAVLGLLLIVIISGVQLAAVVNPRSEWTIKNVYGGSPATTDPTAYFAYNQGYAWADPFFWAPLQVLGSIGMLGGHRWGFLLALMASVPFGYTAITNFIWDRDMRFRQNTLYYWVLVWAMWPAFGVLEGVYCFWRLLD
ncbi:MAG: hypothetical protein OES13_03390 [Acidimicrobiia bacterium]|nr:hypothetical protein [Acidimicrobiia bacterium]